MKKIAVIFMLAAFYACGDSSKTKNDTVAATDQAAAMTNGATNTEETTAEASVKKYDIKSGIITYQNNMQMAGMNIKSKKILYFDDYGNKECEEEYKIDDKGKEILEKRDFVKDGYRYSCSVSAMSGAKTKARGYGVAAPFNMDEASAMKDNQFKKLSDETVCGKNCNSFSMVTPSGNLKMNGWNRIALKTTVEQAQMKMKTEIVAINIEENASIPADKFEVPNGVVLQEM